MDTVKFIEERNRMCKSFDAGCKGCPAFNVCEYELSCAVGQLSTLDATTQIAIVEAWSAAHPHKTRQSVFLEQYPNCMIDNDGVVGICPRNIDNKCICNLERFYDCCGCRDCRREFWMQEVE